MRKQVGLLFLLLINFQSSAFAQQSTLIMDAPKSSETASRFHFLASLTESSNLYRESSVDHEAATELLLNPSFEITPDLTVSLKGAIAHEETHARNTNYSNTSLGLKKNGPSLLDWKSAFSVAATLPTNEDDRKTNRFQGAGALGVSLKNNWKMFELTYGASLTRNFHEYTLNAAGDPNIQYILGQMLDLETELSADLSLSTVGLYKQARTYHDFQRDAFGFEIGLNYNVTKAVQLSAGFSTEGDALRANGKDSNLKFYDENTSVVKASITFVN